jgi:NAD(P)-dependent dehydrogenase (short-subunit alcohol dehydrogenase family)
VSNIDVTFGKGGPSVRTVVVGASSGLGRCIGIGLAQRGHQVALLARRMSRLEDAAKEAGEGAVPLECDITDDASCQAGIAAAAEALGGIDALIYTPGIGPLARLEDTDAETWGRVFQTNVTGAALTTAAALPHLKASNGRVLYLSSIAGSLTPPWPGLGAYAVSKAALDKLVQAWRAEHPDLGFTCVVVGDCAGGEGDAMTGFADGWDGDLAAEFFPGWLERGYLSGTLFDVEELIHAVHALLSAGPSVTIPTITLAPRAGGPTPADFLEGAPS